MPRRRRDPEWTEAEEDYLRAHPSREERAMVLARLRPPFSPAPRSARAVEQRLHLLGLNLRGTLHQPAAPRRSPPPPDALARTQRPAWFDEDRAAFARRLVAGR